MTVTLADVAARAQVSPATVSRVLNGNYPVAATTRERVLRAVDELDYVLNGPASALAAATSDLVGILVNDIADPFFGIMASAIQAEIGGPGGRRGRRAARGGLQHRRLPGAGADLSHPAAAAAGGGGGADRRRGRGHGAPAAMAAKAAQARGGRDAGRAVRAAAGPGDRGDRARPSTTAAADGN